VESTSASLQSFCLLSAAWAISRHRSDAPSLREHSHFGTLSYHS
jgi:hypothetical protein